MKRILLIVGLCLIAIGFIGYYRYPWEFEQKSVAVHKEETPLVLNESEEPKEINNTTALTENEEIIEETKHYLLEGQDDKPEALKLKWSATFLDQVDIEGIYQEYLKSGGEAGNIPAFAEYLTLHAPINTNWQELIKNSIAESYGYEIIKFEQLSDDTYQAYVEMDGKEVPYVVVNTRTGYFHG